MHRIELNLLLFEAVERHRSKRADDVLMKAADHDSRYNQSKESLKLDRKKKLLAIKNLIASKS